MADLGRVGQDRGRASHKPWLALHDQELRAGHLAAQFAFPFLVFLGFGGRIEPSLCRRWSEVRPSSIWAYGVLDLRRLHEQLELDGALAQTRALPGGNDLIASLLSRQQKVAVLPVVVKATIPFNTRLARARAGLRSKRESGTTRWIKSFSSGVH